MIICFAKELHASCIGQCLEAVDHFRSISVELLESGTGNGESHLERALVFLDKIQQEAVHRKITLLRYSPEDGPIGKIIIIMRILTYIEKPVKP